MHTICTLYISVGYFRLYIIHGLNQQIFNSVSRLFSISEFNVRMQVEYRKQTSHKQDNTNISLPQRQTSCIHANSTIKAEHTNSENRY